jgi:hypothetical protein
LYRLKTSFLMKWCTHDCYHVIKVFAYHSSIWKKCRMNLIINKANLHPFADIQSDIQNYKETLWWNMWSTYAIEYCITMLIIQVLYFLSISMPIYIRQYCFYIMDDNMTKIVFNNTTIKIIMKIIFALLLWHFKCKTMVKTRKVQRHATNVRQWLKLVKYKDMSQM